MDDRDRSTAHRHFSVFCFNTAWKLLERTDRTPEEDEDMVRLTMASHWHWAQRDDYTRRSASIGYWQTSRVYAVLGQAENARRYGERSLARREGERGTFYLGYAHEALARAEAVAGRRGPMEFHLAKARERAAFVEDPEERKPLLDDLAAIPGALRSES